MKTRPHTVQGSTVKVLSPAGDIFVTVNTTDREPLEVFITVGKGGDGVKMDAEAMGRLLSLLLRCDGMTPTERLAEAARQLQGIGRKQMRQAGESVAMSLADAVGMGLVNR